MICPECKSDQLSCIDTRPAPDSVRRRRECVACGHRFSTIEISVDRLEKLKARDEKLRYIACVLQKVAK